MISLFEIWLMIALGFALLTGSQISKSIDENDILGFIAGYMVIIFWPITFAVILSCVIKKWAGNIPWLK